MTTRTDEQVTKAFLEVVADAGIAYIYPSLDGSGCFYVYDDHASCLIGRVLFRLGAGLPELARCDDVGGISDRVLEIVDIEISEKAQQALRFAQSAQDQRATWGAALIRYLEVMMRDAA